MDAPCELHSISVCEHALSEQDFAYKNKHFNCCRFQKRRLIQSDIGIKKIYMYNNLFNKGEELL